MTLWTVAKSFCELHIHTAGFPMRTKLHDDYRLVSSEDTHAPSSCMRTGLEVPGIARCEYVVLQHDPT